MNKIIVKIGVLICLIGCNKDNVCKGVETCPPNSETYFDNFIAETGALPFYIRCDNCVDPTPLLAAMNVWNSTLESTYFSYKEEGEVFITVVLVQTLDELKIQYPNRIKDETESFVLVKDSKITLYILQNAYYKIPLLTHELGHTLGMNHSTCRKSIMWPVAGQCQIITQETIDLIKSHVAKNNREFSSSEYEETPFAE